jgi:hypothetical protein
MTNEELILQMLTEMQQSITDLDNNLSGRITDLDNKLSQRIEDNTALINLNIENDVTKRIELLFDGYKLTNEKQRDSDRRVNELETRVEILEIKAG